MRGDITKYVDVLMTPTGPCHCIRLPETRLVYRRGRWVKQQKYAGADIVSALEHGWFDVEEKLSDRGVQVDRAQVEERVKSIVSEQLDVPRNVLKSTTKLAEDLGADSLDQSELVMEVEDEFDLDIPEDDERAGTLGAIIDMVMQCLAKK